MQKPFFSIIVVSLNAGTKLEKTLDSILKQTYHDYEIILKDGESKDGSIEALRQNGCLMKENNIKLIQKKDTGIYDAMNQALSHVNGSYVQFLNCGDYFYCETVLEETAKWILEEKKKRRESISQESSMEEAGKDVSCIYYGNQYNEKQKTVVYSAPKINDFTCYRNVPCHQVCFYDARLFEKRGYLAEYKVRADYEHFLYSIYEEKARGISMPVVVVSYEGGGFSETKENKRRSTKEHKEITKKYLGEGKAIKYRLIMVLSLAPVRTWIAENPVLSDGYNRIKKRIYILLKKN